MKITTSQFAKSFWSAVEGTSQKDTDSVIKAFVVLLKKRGMLSNKRAIVEAIEHERDVQKNHKGVLVTSAHILSSNEKKAIEQGIKKSYRVDRVTLVNKVDESLIGGVVIQVGWEKFTNSIQHRIAILKNAV